jgi:anaerobic selenocysteine-containing dehydrogenase
MYGLIATYGSQAIMPYSYLGNEGLVQGLTAGDAFFNKLGSTVNEETFCASGSSTAWLLTVGPTGVDPESFVHSKYIVIWACNSISTNLHHWPFVLEARKRGAKVVVIDSYPVAHRKAGRLAHHAEARNDGAFAVGVIAALIENNLVDREWVENHTVGFGAGRTVRDAEPEGRRGAFAREIRCASSTTAVISRASPGSQMTCSLV